MRCWPAILFSLIVFGLVVPVRASADDKKPVDIEIWVIRATTKNTEISKELRGIAATLKKQFKYTGFKLEKKARGRAAIGKTFKASLIGGYSATITPKVRLDKRIQLQVVVTKPADKGTKTVLKTTLTIKAGPLLPVGGLPLDGGDALIMAIRAR